MPLAGTYRPRHPEHTAFYQCLEDYWEEFKQAYPYFYEKDYGPWRPVVEKTVERFLQCGILRHGFARLRCSDCRREQLLPFSCKTRCFCPSCQAKQVAAFLEQALEQVLEEVDHRQLVWTIPRVLRPAFYKDRKLLGELCRCAWASLRDYVQGRLGPGSVPGAILTIQTWGEHLRAHAHLHGLVSDTAWNRDGSVDSIGEFDSSLLSRLFQHRVLEMMVQQHRLSPEFAQRLRCWSPSGFGVYCSGAIPPEDRPALERLAAYIRRPSFAASRLDYDSDQGQILYRTAKGTPQSLDALDWIARVCSHIPDRNEHQIRYYGRYASASRGKRRQQQKAVHGPASEECPAQEESAAERFSRRRRRSWARLLRKIYDVDPLRWGCGGSLRVIAVIEQPHVIRQILAHLKQGQRPQRAPPPRLFPQKLEHFLAELSPQQAQAVRASDDSLFWDEVPDWPH